MPRTLGQSSVSTVARKTRVAASTKGDFMDFASYVAKKGSRFSTEDKQIIVELLIKKWGIPL